jgi:hypothetical protein
MTESKLEKQYQRMNIEEAVGSEEEMQITPPHTKV